MTSYPNQFLYLGDADGCPREIVNGARAALNLTVGGMCATGQFSNVLDGMGCDALAWAPMCVINKLDEIQSTFEPNIDGWSALVNASIARSTSQSKQGSGSLRLQSVAAGDMSSGTPTGTNGFAVTPGAVYMVRGWAKSASAARLCYVFIRYYTSGGAFISESYSAGITTSTSQWREDSVVSTAPANAAYGACVVWISGTAAAGEQHYFDQIGVFQRPAGSSILEPWVVGDYFADEPSIAWGQWIINRPDDPWDNGATAASDALGIVIEEWTGIDGAHHTRAQVPVGVNRGGARFGPHAHRQRVMKLNVLLLGRSEQGLTHLFRWLENQLIDQGSACAERSLWLRDYCPTVNGGSDATEDQLRAGWYRLDRVALVEGPTWESEPVKDGGGCYLRRVSFTIVAGDPCMYGYGTNVFNQQMSVGGLSWSGGYTVASCSKWTTSNVRAQATVAAGTTGFLAPRVTIRSHYEVDGSDPKNLPDLRIFGIATPDYGTVTPCTGDKLGELVISPYQLAGAEIVIDFASRTIKYRDIDHDVEWSDGAVLLRQSAENIRRWWDFGLKGGTVYVEPYYDGLTNKISGDAVAVLYGWFVKIDMVPKIGCA